MNRRVQLGFISGLLSRLASTARNAVEQPGGIGEDRQTSAGEPFGCAEGSSSGSKWCAGTTVNRYGS